MSKRLLFEIAHPKHFHQFKNLFQELNSKYEIKIIARDKDVVMGLLDEAGLPYTEYGMHGKTMMKKLLAVPGILAQYWSVIKEFNPDLILSRSSPYAAILSKFSRAKSVIFPDSEAVTFNNNFVVPLSDITVTPATYALDHGKKHYKVNGFFENAYLHPRYFKRNKSVLNEMRVKKNEPFFLIRLVGWFANHDVDKQGFTYSEKIHLVKFLEEKGKVFISGEGNLIDELKPYQLQIKPQNMHSVLSFANLYIGDSQTMATESALLGTPAIRYNSFVGENDMSNFKILENRYELLTNAANFDEVLKKAGEIINDNNSKSKYIEKSKRYFLQTGDTNKETASLITNILENET